jgi:3-isopropylmalate dehydrogenase
LNAGDEHAMAQATHGSAPDIAGKGIANPTGEILSTSLFMRWLAERHHDSSVLAVAERIDGAIQSVLSIGEARTPDLGGRATTSEFTQAVVACLK